MTTQMNETEIAKLKTYIDENQKFVLTCHTNADGDALGSTLGLRRVLMAIGKEATVIVPDLPPSFYSWMPDFKTVKTYERETEVCDALIDAADCVFVMDYNDLKRVKSLGEKIIATGKPTLMIDHHTAPQLQANVCISEPEAPATCEIAYRLCRAMGLEDKIDVKAATLFYSGIITDTGGLSYNSSQPELYILVADLLRKGIDKTTIHNNIFNNKNMRRLKLLGYTLHRKMHRIEKLPLAVMALDKEELDRFKYNTGDTEGFVNFPLQAKDVIATALILDRPDCIKISIRSKGDFPVNEFAAEYYGGGGHINAAGANCTGDFDEVVKQYEKNITEFYLRKSLNIKKK